MSATGLAWQVCLKNLLFLPERKKVNKVKKHICNIEDKEKYVRSAYESLKQALNHGLLLKKKYIEKFIDMIPKLKKEAKNDFEKDFFKLMYNCF